MMSITLFFKAASQRHIVVNALRLSLIVGTILNAINQGEAILHVQGIVWGQLALNYLVPYCVATYSASKNELRNYALGE